MPYYLYLQVNLRLSPPTSMTSRDVAKLLDFYNTARTYIGNLAILVRDSATHYCDYPNYSKSAPWATVLRVGLDQKEQRR